MCYCYFYQLVINLCNMFMLKENRVATILISIMLLSWIAGWLRLTAIPVNVNGKKVYVKYGETASDAIKKAGFKITYGRMLAVDGSVINNRRGKPPLIYFNEKVVNLDYPIKTPGSIIYLKGKDSHEPNEHYYEIYEKEPVVIGRGPFLKLKSIQMSGFREVIIGKLSGRRKIVELREAKPAVYEKTDGSKQKICALTFDDGPSPYTKQILKILDSYGIKATFFLIGKHVEKHPDIARLIAAKGHTIGNHTFSHPPLGKLSSTSIKKEIVRAEEAIFNATGVKPVWFRPPMRSINYEVFYIAQKSGLRLVLWDVDPFDWQKPGSSAIYARVIRSVKPNSVILLHDGGGDRSQTISALPAIIEALQRKGYVFVPLDFFLRKKV